MKMVPNKKKGQIVTKKDNYLINRVDIWRNLGAPTTPVVERRLFATFSPNRDQKTKKPRRTSAPDFPLFLFIRFERGSARMTRTVKVAIAIIADCGGACAIFVIF